MKIQTIVLALFIIFANNNLVKAGNYENSSLVSRVIQDHAEFFSQSSLDSFKTSPWNFVKNLGFSDIEYTSSVGDGCAVAFKARRIRPPYLLLVPICILGCYVIYKKYFKKNQEEEQKN